MSQIQDHVVEFYGLVSRLASLPHQGARLDQLGALRCLPKRGVYYFQESGELNSLEQGQSRVVRVGTHAVSAGSKSTLQSRLRAHLGTKAGLGNHRGSIFRLHAGNAFLRKEERAIPTWGKGSVAPPELRADPAARDAEAALERQVSQYIGGMTVLWIDVPDEPGSTSLRSVIERNSIALLSNKRSPVIAASQSWLGHFSPRQEIRESYLWNLNHIGETYDPLFLEQLKYAINRTERSAQSSF